jgi:hypothetical protein
MATTQDPSELACRLLVELLAYITPIYVVNGWGSESFSTLTVKRIRYQFAYPVKW